MWRSDDGKSLRHLKTYLCYRKIAVKRYWQIIADNLSEAGWSWGYVSAVDAEGQNNLDC
jgi:hypothetical protein